MSTAWVTLATNDKYALGALVLAHSLKRAKTRHHLHILYTDGVTAQMRSRLLAVFYNSTHVDVLDSNDTEKLALIGRPDLGITFTKLHCWRLTQYEKCVFLDADTLIIQNCDELFDRPEFAAAPDIGWPDLFNSGVFVFVPSNDTYHKLVEFGTQRGTFDGGDQGLLNLYFSKWREMDASHRLPFIYNVTSGSIYSYKAAYQLFGGNIKIVHFLGTVKPWHRGGEKHEHQSDHWGYWQQIFEEDVKESVRKSNFVETCSMLSNNCYEVSLFRSELSGMRVAFVCRESPILSGFFTFGTKATDDSGLPHIIEHLVFMGSTNYPSEKILDSILNICFSTYPNAITSQDQTNYPLHTVGSEGFLKALPVYLDHLFNPEFTPEHYITEIHHVNGDGCDGGVLFAEQQDKENKITTIIGDAFRRSAFPEGHPYRARIGGSLSALREGCSMEDIVSFHKQYYNFSNLIITIVGSVDETKVIDILTNFETSNSQHSSQFKRPFDDVIFDEHYEEKFVQVDCLAKDDTNGAVELTWQGPMHYDQDSLALPIFLSYFCDGLESPLQQNYVTDLKFFKEATFSIRSRNKIEISISLHGVRKDLLDGKDVFTYGILTQIQNLEIDIERINGIIEHKILEMTAMLENDPSEHYRNIFAAYALYAPDVSVKTDNVDYLQKQLNVIANLKTLLQCDKAYWKQLTTKIFTTHIINVAANPNIHLAGKLAATEKDLIQNRIKNLGKEGLKEHADVLENATKKNKANVPPEGILQKFIVDNIDINHMRIERSFCECNNPSIIFHKADTKFLHATIVFDLHELPSKYLSLLPLYNKMVTKPNILMDNEEMNFQKVEPRLRKDFLVFKVTFLNAYPEFLAFHYQLSPENFPKIEYWTEKLLKQVVFEKSRVAAFAEELAADAALIKKDGGAIAKALLTNMIAVENSNKIFSCPISGSNFHGEIAQLTSVEKKDKLLNLLRELADQISVCPRNIHFFGNKDILDQISSNKTNFSSMVNNSTEALKGLYDRCIDFTKNEGKTFCIRYDRSESSFLVQRSKASFTLMEPKIVYAQLLCKYFSMSGGPLFDAVRGNGIAYSVEIYVAENTGLELYIGRASDLPKAYKESRRVVLKTLESGEMDKYQFEAAKGSLIAELVQEVSNASDAGMFSVVEHIHGLRCEESIIKYSIAEILKATPEKVFHAVSQDFKDLFDDSKFIRALVPSTNAMDEINECFENVTVKRLEDMCYKNLVFN